MDLDGLRRKIANYLGGQGAADGEDFTDEAVKVGDLSAMKYLFELIGLHPVSGDATGDKESDDGNDIAAALLAELGFSAKSDEKSGDDGEVAASVEGDSVE